MPKRSKLGPVTRVLCVLTIAAVQLFIAPAVQAQSSLIGSISVDNNRVSTVTNFNFDLISTSETVATNDYLEIVLPSDLDSRFISSGNSRCEVNNASISQCLIVSSKVCRIVFASRMSTT